MNIVDLKLYLEEPNVDVIPRHLPSVNKGDILLFFKVTATCDIHNTAWYFVCRLTPSKAFLTKPECAVVDQVNVRSLQSSSALMCAQWFIVL